MKPVSPGAARYDLLTILFHWLVAILVVEQFLGAQIIDWFPKGPLRVDARSVHIVLGAPLASVLVLRLLWRFSFGRQLQPQAGFLNLVAKGVHHLLYLLLIAMMLVGFGLAFARGDSLFNAYTLPSFAPGNNALAHQIAEVHETLAWIILAIAGLHAVAALVHRFIMRDGIYSRMLLRG